MIKMCFAALHPMYGLVWTNGTAVFVTLVDVIKDKLKSTSSIQLAVFE